MTLFVLLGALMVLGALILLVPVLLRPRQAPAPDREAENVVIARERLAELKADLASGAIDGEQFEAARAELEAALLDDVSGETPRSLDERSGAYGRWAAVALLLLLPWGVAAVYLGVGEPSALDGEVTRAAAARTDPHAGVSAEGQPASLEDLMSRLEARLAEAPDDANGWFLLARTYMSTGRYPEAVAALERLRGLTGDNARVLVALADAVAMTQGGRVAGRPADLAEKALALDPNAPTALWLSGIAAQERGEHRRALELLQRLEPQLQDDPESLQEVRQMMARARQALGETAPAATPTPAAPPTTASMPSEAGAALQVRVALDPALAERVSPSDTLFVYARALEGPPMPLAVARHKAGELPLTVTLDDSMAMMPAMRLSAFPQVRIQARVSRSGNAITQSGDLLGEVAPVETDRSGLVEVRIDDVAP